MTSGQVGISREVHGRYRDMSPSLSPRFFLTIRTTRYHLSDICFALIAFVLSPLIGLKFYFFTVLQVSNWLLIDTIIGAPSRRDSIFRVDWFTTNVARWKRQDKTSYLMNRSPLPPRLMMEGEEDGDNESVAVGTLVLG